MDCCAAWKLDSHARRRAIGRFALAYGAQLEHRGPDSRANARAVLELAHRVEPVAHGAALGQRHLAQALAPHRLDRVAPQLGDRSDLPSHRRARVRAWHITRRADARRSRSARARWP